MIVAFSILKVLFFTKDFSLLNLHAYDTAFVPNTGQWLNTNGESIYESVPWKYQNDTVTPNVW